MGDERQPQADDGPREWEARGAVRRDCEPHRGPLLTLLSVTGLILGGLSICLAVPALAALPLGAASWAMAARDLAEMGAGRMDRAGRRAAHQALWSGKVTVLLCSYGLACGACVYL